MKFVETLEKKANEGIDLLENLDIGSAKYNTVLENTIKSFSIVQNISRSFEGEPEQEVN